jgi:hypothetical protein
MGSLFLKSIGSSKLNNSIIKMVSITVDNLKIPIHVDNKGNLYFKVNNNLLQLNVDKNDDPVLESGNYEIMYESGISSKGKIIKSEKFENDEYFPEDNGHTLVDDSYQDDEYDEEAFFKFYDLDSHLEIRERENGDILALYDIFIYDDHDTQQPSKLIFQSKMQNEMVIYRVVLYTSGKIYFRPLGCDKEKKYEIHTDNEKICINVI